MKVCPALLRLRRLNLRTLAEFGVRYRLSRELRASLRARIAASQSPPRDCASSPRQ